MTPGMRSENRAGGSLGGLHVNYRGVVCGEGKGRAWKGKDCPWSASKAGARRYRPGGVDEMAAGARPGWKGGLYIRCAALGGILLEAYQR